MLLSENQEAAARALVTFLHYQSGHAQRDALGFPDEVAAAIAEHALDRLHAAESIKDELNRLYDRRRDGHARSVAEETKHQQQVLAARIVIERELGVSPEESQMGCALLNDEELAAIAALTLEPNCKEQIGQIVDQAGQRRAAAQNAQADAAAVAEQQLAETTAQTLADAEQKKVEETVIAPPASPAEDVAGGTPLPNDK